MKKTVKDPLEKGKLIVIIATNEPHRFLSECRDLVNELILKCNLLTPRVSSFKLINSDVVGSLFESILRVKPFHVKRDEEHRYQEKIYPERDEEHRYQEKIYPKRDEKHRYQEMICHLSEILSTDVSHLSGAGMASKDPKQLFFLLEILSTILESQNSPSISSSDTDTNTTCQLPTHMNPEMCAKCPSCQPLRRQRDFSPESCCSCSCRSRPPSVSSSSVSSCVCSDLEHSSDSCDCTCSLLLLSNHFVNFTSTGEG